MWRWMGVSFSLSPRAAYNLWTSYNTCELWCLLFAIIVLCWEQQCLHHNVWVFTIMYCKNMCMCIYWNHKSLALYLGTKDLSHQKFISSFGTRLWDRCRRMLEVLDYKLGWWIQALHFTTKKKSENELHYNSTPINEIVLSIFFPSTKLKEIISRKCWDQGPGMWLPQIKIWVSVLVSWVLPGATPKNWVMSSHWVQPSKI